MPVLPDNQFVSIWCWFSPYFLSAENPFSSFMRKSMEKILYERRDEAAACCCWWCAVRNQNSTMQNPRRNLNLETFFNALRARKILLLIKILRPIIIFTMNFLKKLFHCGIWNILFEKSEENTKQKLYHH